MKLVRLCISWIAMRQRGISRNHGLKERNDEYLRRSAATDPERCWRA